MKTTLLLLTVLASGCAHNAYKPQTITARGSHALILHKDVTAMQNAYEALYVKYDYKAEPKERGTYSGFFDPNTNTSHCHTPWPEGCMLHEYKHLLVKYGLIVPDDPHFKKKVSKTIRIIKWR